MNDIQKGLNLFIVSLGTSDFIS